MLFNSVPSKHKFSQFLFDSYSYSNSYWFTASPSNQRWNVTDIKFWVRVYFIEAVMENRLVWNQNMRINTNVFYSLKTSVAVILWTKIFAPTIFNVWVHSEDLYKGLQLQKKGSSYTYMCLWVKVVTQNSTVYLNSQFKATNQTYIQVFLSSSPVAGIKE